ncbi:histidine phosphatase superfamily [Boletus edulis BED1]|uniref:Histidine phosphatase superfamily n=1 Tax=Boletus edulis BED1 TaxID=1328754 RepID=A0AAD4C8L0_BOLED|nr:histidine phosphatase superfamily [Boletus edulis BED1]
MSSGHYKEYDPEPGLQEHIGLLSGSQPTIDGDTIDDGRHLTVDGGTSSPKYALKHLLASFTGGIAACLAVQLSLFGPGCYTLRERTGSSGALDEVNAYAPPWVGSTTVHNYPPPSPTNDFPELFPTNVGYPGGTPTGAEPAIIATAPSQPLQTGAAQLVAPAYDSLPGPPSNHTIPNERPFNLFRSWGNLSPWYSVPRGAFGIDEGAKPPPECDIKGVHILHRHGARYPTAWANYGGPASLARRLHKTAEQWDATGRLAFLNDWTYKLGEEVLTPFGRQQLYDLGVAMRLKYGFLLEDFTAQNKLPAFRTESQDRMHASAVNFALGFFGWPLDGKYEQVITIEASGFNNTLAPYGTCPNAGTHNKADRSLTYVKKWAGIYLEQAQKRLQADLKPTDGGQGFNLEIEDVYRMQQMCAYETVALGYSKFCELFTEEEWEGFNYALDLTFWYDSAFGSPVARVQGVGYLQELISRLTHEPIEMHNSSTNATLHADDRTWPLNDVLYVDATHEVVVLNILTALNLTTLTASGPLPADHVPANRSFRVADLAPFATNVQFQLLSCPASESSVDSDASHIRIVVNDGPVPLTGIRGCPPSSSGLCPLQTFIEAQKATIREVDWKWGCSGDWEVPEGSTWETLGGWYPQYPEEI